MGLPVSFSFFVLLKAGFYNSFIIFNIFNTMLCDNAIDRIMFFDITVKKSLKFTLNYGIISRESAWRIMQ